MSETNQKTTNEKHRAAPADAATPFFTFQTFWKGEMSRLLDETGAAMERGYGEWERMAQESSRLSTAGMKSMHDANRQWMAAARTLLG
jgi:hypothetical protein